MKCLQCGEANPDGASKCKKCGGELPEISEKTRPYVPEETEKDSIGETQPDVLGETVDDLGTAGLSKTARSPMEVPTKVPKPKPELAKTQPAPDEELTRGLTKEGLPRQPSYSKTGTLTVHSVFARRYEIQQLLGEGGMGRVYKARDLELDKAIALKTLRGEGAAEPGVIQRFKQELLLARKIKHKNVIRIHDFGEAQGVKFFTMELIEGDNLKQIIRGRGKIPLDEALTLARQILSALTEAHSQGVIHRDLKPQNIMVDRNGVPQIMDFGIARSAEETSGVTVTGTVIGTPDYMSPEQVRGQKAGPPSDLFSFGVILYEMLTGDLPYKADTPISKVMMRLTEKPPPPRELNTDLPKYLEDVVLKCLEVDPVLRYQTAQEILHDLDREHVDRSLTLRMKKAVGRRKALVAAAAVVLAVGAALFLIRGRGASPVPEQQVPVTTLAILPFTNATGSVELEWLRTGLPEMLMTDIAQSRYVRPVPGERVLKVMRELGIAEYTRFDESALNLISERAPAQSVLHGQYVESAGDLRLDLILRGVSGVPTPLSVEGSSTDLFALVDQITAGVKERLDLTPEQLKGDSDRPITEVSTTSLTALRAYYAGLSELRKGANLSAIPLLEESVSNDAHFAMAQAKLAEAYLNANEHNKARAAIEQAVELSEVAVLPVAERYSIHAVAARVESDYRMAAESYGELAKLYPRDPDILLSLGRAQEELGMFPEALESYRHAIQIAPDYSEGHVGIAWVLIFSGRSPEAIVHLEQALTAGRLGDDPETQGTVHSILGMAYRETADYDQSMEHYELCLDYREQAGDRMGQAMALGSMAPIYFERGETGEALRVLSAAVEIARELGDREVESDFLVDTGFIYQESGNLDKALASFRSSMQIEMEREDHARLANRLNTIAEVYRLKGQYDDAIVYLEQAKTHLAQTEDKRDMAFNFQHIGQVRKAQGLYEQAIEAFLEAQSLFQEAGQDATESVTQLDLSEIYRIQGRFADACTAVERSMEIGKELGTEHDVSRAATSLGRLLTTLGRPEDAERAFLSAETGADDEDHGHREPTDAPTPEHLLGRAELAHLAGRLDEAAEAYQKANYEANLSGRKEVAVESRVALGRLYLEQGKLPNAERLLERTEREAAEARLRPMEAEAAIVLADVYLSKGDAEAARKSATDAIAIAENYSGRPALYRSRALLGEAYKKLGRTEQALDSYAEAASILEWIRGSLAPDHVQGFMGRSDIQAFLKDAADALKRGGRAAEAADLEKWIVSAAPTTEDS